MTSPISFDRRMEGHICTSVQRGEGDDGVGATRRVEGQRSLAHRGQRKPEDRFENGAEFLLFPRRSLFCFQEGDS